MLIHFFYTLKQAGLPVSLRELLDLIGALEAQVAFASIDDFYIVSRAIMVKDEKFYDKFDKAFAAYFKGLEDLDGLLDAMIPDEWLRKEIDKLLSDEEKAKIESLGSLEKLIEEFKKRLEEQSEKHEGGNKWIGTGGTSPFGQQGYHPEGIRVGPNSTNKRAAKVWDKREFKDLDDSNVVGARNISVALKRLRKFARTGAQDELDLDHTIKATAKNAGLLDIKMRAEKHNAVKVLLFFDVGGSMDPFIRMCEELFSAAKSEFKHLEYYYFHNFTYEAVWKNNVRRHNEDTSLVDVIHTYGKDYKVIFIGDASMSPYEVVSVGGNVEYYNDKPGQYYFQKIMQHFDKVAWLNPVPENQWGYTQSIAMIQELVDNQMYPMTIEGLEAAMVYLSH